MTEENDFKVHVEPFTQQIVPITVDFFYCHFLKISFIKSWMKLTNLPNNLLLSSPTCAVKEMKAFLTLNILFGIKTLPEVKLY